jgi:hypothetical protein
MNADECLEFLKKEPREQCFKYDDYFDYTEILENKLFEAIKRRSCGANTQIVMVTEDITKSSIEEFFDYLNKQKSLNKYFCVIKEEKTYTIIYVIIR